jgi:hypothetical protein
MFGLGDKFCDEVTFDGGGTVAVGGIAFADLHNPPPIFSFSLYDDECLTKFKSNVRNL